MASHSMSGTEMDGDMYFFIPDIVTKMQNIAVCNARFEGCLIRVQFLQGFKGAKDEMLMCQVRAVRHYDRGTQ